MMRRIAEELAKDELGARQAQGGRESNAVPFLWTQALSSVLSSVSCISLWQPYRDHVSKRTTFNDNDPIKPVIYSDVTRQRGAFAARAVLVVGSK
jgi:hypothetical protein